MAAIHQRHVHSPSLRQSLFAFSPFLKKLAKSAFSHQKVTQYVSLITAHYMFWKYLLHYDSPFVLAQLS